MTKAWTDLEKKVLAVAPVVVVRFSGDEEGAASLDMSQAKIEADQVEATLELDWSNHFDWRITAHVRRAGISVDLWVEVVFLGDEDMTDPVVDASVRVEALAVAGTGLAQHVAGDGKIPMIQGSATVLRLVWTQHMDAVLGRQDSGPRASSDFSNGIPSASLWSTGKRWINMPPLAPSPWQTGDQPDFRLVAFSEPFDIHQRAPVLSWLYQEAHRPTHGLPLDPPVVEGRSEDVPTLYRSSASWYPWDYEHLAATHLAFGAVRFGDWWLEREVRHRARLLLAEYGDLQRVWRIPRGVGRLLLTAKHLAWALGFQETEEAADLGRQLERLAMNVCRLAFERLYEQDAASFGTSSAAWRSRMGWERTWRPWEDAWCCVGLAVWRDEWPSEESWPRILADVAGNVLRHGIWLPGDGAAMARDRLTQSHAEAMLERLPDFAPPDPSRPTGIYASQVGGSGLLWAGGGITLWCGVAASYPVRAVLEKLGKTELLDRAKAVRRALDLKGHELEVVT